MKNVAIIIPVYNEEKSIGLVLNEIPSEFLCRTIVVNNNSTDNTMNVIKSFNDVHLVHESRQGYGSACLAGIKKLKSFKDIDYVVFLDGDYSDFPKDIFRLLGKIQNENLDLVIGSRNLGEAEAGALLPQAKFGNWLATTLLALRFGYKFTDLGPFRVIKRRVLDQIQMQDADFGWTMEMQVKALKYDYKVGEVSVRYKKRVGVSKITGTIKGTVLAGYKILWTLFKYSLPDSYYEFLSFCRSKI